VPQTDIFVDTPLAGWDGAGISKKFIKVNGTFTFSVSRGSIGVVIGVNQSKGRSNYGYTDIDAGFIFSRGNVSIIENGAKKTALGDFTNDDEFGIRIINGVINYVKNGVIVEPSGLAPSDERWFLDTSMYLSGDTVISAKAEQDVFQSIVSSRQAASPSQLDFRSNTTTKFTNTSFKQGTTIHVAVQRFNSTTGFAVERHTLLGVLHFDQKTGFTFDTSVSLNTSHVSLSALGGMATDSSGGQSINSLSSFESIAYNNLFTLDFAGSTSVLAGVVSQASGITGGTTVGSDNQVLANAFIGTASDHSYAESANTLQGLGGIAGAFPESKVGACRIEGATEEGTAQGSGILLSTGRHVLTAAHVVDGYFDINSIELKFIHDAGVSLPTYKVYRMSIHPLWLGIADDLTDIVPRAKYDLAILELTNYVDPIVKRHGLYTQDDELFKEYDRTSYSPRVHPVTGAVSAKGWDLTRNRVGLISEGNSLLYSDYDDGTAEHDAFGLKYNVHNLGVAGEGGIYFGDSGSGLLINDRIAGILSLTIDSATAADINPGHHGTYGDVFADTRVSDHIDWVVANANNTSPYAGVDPAFPDAPYALRAMNAFVEAELADFEVEAQGTGGTASTGDIELPGFEVGAFSAAHAGVDLFDFETVATATQYALATAGVDLFDFEVEAAGEMGAIGDADFKLGFEFGVAAVSGSYSAFELGGFEVEATATSYGVGTSSLELPGFEVEAKGETLVNGGHAELELLGFEAIYGYTEVNIFGLVTDARGSEVSAGTPLKKAYAINVAHTETTIYPDYAFNQIVKLDGLYYGVRPDGLYLLEGPDDEGGKIQATIQTADMDFGTARHKRVPYAYLDTTDTTTIEPFTEERKIGKYTSSFKGRRTRLARGARGRFWSFKVANVDGAPLDLRSLELYTNAVGRKV